MILRILKSQAGMTLTELLVASGLASVALILMAAVMAETTNLSKAFEARARDEVAQLTAERQLRNVFLQAVDLTYMGNQDLNAFTGQGNFEGGLRAFNSDTEFGVTPSVRTLAVFWREARLSFAPATVPAQRQSGFVRTGVFFQLPTPTTYGVLYIDLGREPGQLKPERNDLTFEGLVSLRITNIQTFNAGGSAAVAFPAASPSPVTSFDIEMVLRKFINPKGQADFVYCPFDLMDKPGYPACVTKTPSRDVVRTIRIIVRNNVLTVSPTADTSDLSGPPTGGKWGARIYDRIHFFRPTAASGLL